MNKIVKNYIKEQMKLPKAKNSEVRQYEILDAMRKLHIQIPDTVNRKNLVDAVFNSDKCNVFLACYQDRFMISLNELAKFYDMQSLEIMRLNNAGIIKEQPINRVFYNLDNSAFQKKVFKLSALLYDPKYLKKKSRELEHFDVNLRMEVENDKLSSVINLLNSCFEINISKIGNGHGKVKGRDVCCVYLQARIKESDHV